MVTKKKILITAGPTWVPIDKVRVISNIATGETGILLAKKLQRLGAQVTLILGPVGECSLKKIKLLRFKFFDELKNLVSKELKSKKYAVVIHSAAVSDYRPAKIYSQKIKSGIKNWKLNLVPTLKIIDLIKKIDRSLFVVGFKFETQTEKKILIEKAKKIIRYADLDLAVANSANNKQYRAYIVNHIQSYGPVLNKKEMAEKLTDLIGEYLWKD